MTDDTLSPSSNDDSLTKYTLSPDSDTASVSSSLKRPHRPPDLDLTSLNLTPIQHQDITIVSSSGQSPPSEPKGQPLTGKVGQPRPPPGRDGTSDKKRDTSVSQSEVDPTRSSTPTTTKLSGSVSERVSLAPITQRHCKYLIKIAVGI